MAPEYTHTHKHTHTHYLKILYEVQKYSVTIIMYIVNLDTHIQYVQLCLERNYY